MISEAERRRVMDRLPWPNVRGKRCLDIGSADGHLTAELERRGAAEVVTIAATPPTVADLDPARIGRFDVVVCESMLRWARDPIETLEAVHRVTIGMLLSAEPIDLWSSVRSRGKPVFTESNEAGASSTFNGAAHQQMLRTSGFRVERVSKAYTLPWSDGPDDVTWRARVDALVTRVITGSPEPGRLHRALLARAGTE